MNLRTKRIILAALVSARVKDPEAELAELESAVAGAGGVVVGRLLQRRGVSRDKRPGGSKRMDRPLSAATLIGKGKAGDLAALCQEASADLVLFKNSLSPTQRSNLAGMCGVPVVDAEGENLAS